MAPSRQHHHHPNNDNHHSTSLGASFPPLGGATTAFPSSHDEGKDASNQGDPSAGLPPAPQKVDASQAQACRLQDAYWSDEEEDMDCPLCLEEIDISDANFKPCPCGYQICRFCWHHIKSNLNGRCPACRRKYTDTSVEFKAMSQDEIKRLGQAKKQKEREKKELEQMNRKHLANMRVVQKNLVYVVGLDPKLAKEELIPTLRSNEFFGQYGRISKILISKRTTASKLVMGTQESAIGVYVTYVRKEDAAKAIVAIDGSKGPDGKPIRASYGTTKYCTNYLRNLPCANTICTYLHEPGEEADSFTKEDLSTLRHAAKDTEHKSSRPIPPPASFSLTGSKSTHSHPQQQLDIGTGAAVAASTTSAINSDSIESSALPKTASWASTRPGGSNGIVSNAIISTNIRDQSLPPLSAVQQQQSRRSNGRNNSSSMAVKLGGQNRGASASNAITSGADESTETRRSESPIPASFSATASPIFASIALPSTPSGMSKVPPKAPSAMQQSSKLRKTSREEKVDTIVQEKEVQSSNAVNTPQMVVPPGLTKKNLNQDGNSRPSTPSLSQEAVVSKELTPPASINTHSNYQPSSKAQALLDDMKSRRAAESEYPTKSPFPDFDAVLSNFRNGDDFCFTLEESQIPASIKDRYSNTSSTLSAFTPFPLNHQQSSYFGRNNNAATPPPPPPPPPPPGIATPNKTRAQSPAPFAGAMFSNEMADNSGMMTGVYNGPFDPFASSADGLDPMMKLFGAQSLSDQQQGKQDSDLHEAYEDDESKPSRFGFSKRRELLNFKTHEDLLGFIKGGAKENSVEDESEGRSMQIRQNDSFNWFKELQKQGANNNSNAQSNDRFTFESGNHAFTGNGVNNANLMHNYREDPLLAQIINTNSHHGPMENLPYNDPAIMSFTRQQQQQNAAQSQQHQMISQDSNNYAGGFNPFDASSQSTPPYRSPSGYQQPYRNHRA